ncbi:iron-sulfur cluster-binding domain-containing protein [Actinospica sp.]|uniref:flavin reductase family protein n=1 Tax=Actinospica sp. TaxID=1872142 RepID=UPI002B51EE0E|nr:iron-sulfur cluster-binding domain-containing protein [Actinospica sp.]HWG22494.1 iron-sulfur cluster-binding domain-containing protein [Actinospica sp.]
MDRPHRSWDPATDDDEFVCRAVRSITPEIKTVVLAPRQPSMVRFEAGQYVTIEFDIDGRAVHRCYTIASPPTRPERIAITVKRAEGGAVSRWLHDGGIAPGTVVRIGPPQGEFILAAHPAPAYLLLTAGSGITPALSMLRMMYDLGDARDVVLVHSQRHAAEIPYREELDHMAGHVPGLRVHYLCSDESARLDARTLATLAPDAASREVLACGPTSYREAARKASSELGCAAGRFHEESFSFSAPRSAEAAADISNGGFRVEFRDHGVTVDCPPETTLLDAAAAAGLALPSSCAQGLCGTCKSTLISGDVDMRHNGGIRPREIAAGRILLCCSRPTSDLVVAA